MLRRRKAERLSTQAEIDNFIEVAWETVPAVEPEPTADYDVPALLPPDKSA